MRIVHIITRLILGGAQENTLLTVKGQQAMDGRYVTLITGPAIGPEGELVNDARKSGVDMVIVDEMRREIHPWRDLKTLFTLTRLLRDIRPDVVHTHSSKAGIIGRIAAHRAKVPIIVHTIHGQAFHDYQPWWQRKLFRWLEARCARVTDRIISVCDAMTEQAVDAGLAGREKFITIYSGIEVRPFLEGDGDRNALRRRFGLSSDDLVVGKVARLADLKGHKYLIRAAGKILDRFSRLKLFFVGDGALRDELEQLAKSVGLGDRVVFNGLVPPQVVPDCIRAMDVLAHASLREGLARALPQALLSGVPVISFDVDGAREVVIPGRTGWLVEPRSIDGLAEALEEALGDLDHARELAANGRELCRERFPAEVMVERITKLYDELIREAGAKTCTPRLE